MSQNTLFEIGVEELPAKQSQRLSLALVEGVGEGLKAAGLQFQSIKGYVTPRRLAVSIESLASKTEEKKQVRRGPAKQAAFNDAGEPSRALEGFLKSTGATLSDLHEIPSDKGAYMAFESLVPGEAVQDLLPAIIEQAIKKLPIAKGMRWGSGEVTFLRPVHWVVLLYGKEVIQGKLFNLPFGNKTYGHRFHAPDAICLSSADVYEDALNQAQVMPSFDERRASIVRQIQQLADGLGATPYLEDALLDEVTGLVEYPTAFLGRFGKDFLNIPKEALMASQIDHQKTFPLMINGELIQQFAFISHLVADPKGEVVKGNERVMSARLSDAKFFYETDQKTPLTANVEKLKKVTFHEKLGSVHDKVLRLQALGRYFSETLGLDDAAMHQAATLCKADLLTLMVGEFPELQGIMGGYYAKACAGEAVSEAIAQHYKPAGPQDSVPSSDLGGMLSLTDKLDTLCGYFSVGLIPTGEKDPFGLRRAALGILRILLDKGHHLSLSAAIKHAMSAFHHSEVATCQSFILQRLKIYLVDKGFAHDVVEAVVSQHGDDILDVNLRATALSTFMEWEQSASLAAANKRVRKLLASADEDVSPMVDEGLLTEKAEKALYQRLQAAATTTIPLIEKRQYLEALEQLAPLKEPVDTFFDEVMVMVDDQVVKNNRLALLAQLYELFGAIADFSLIDATKAQAKRSLSHAS